MFNWLVNNRHLPVPLGTCRLLLAPSEAEKPRLGLAPEHKPLEATRANFATSAAEWRDDASSRPGNVAFFYFAGHGVQRTHGDHVLLFPGFGKPGNATPILWEGVALDDIMVGMGPSSDRPDVARTQFYFVDACRDRVDPFDQQEWNSVPPLWKIPKLNPDMRDAVLFRTTAYGSPAYSIPNDKTVFAQALLDCLGGLAGVDDGGVYDNATGDPLWCVTANSLNNALNDRIPAISDAHGLPHQQVEPSGRMSNLVITLLDKVPSFPVTLRAIPSGADKVAKMAVCDDDGQIRGTYLQPFPCHPITAEFPGGYYEVRAIQDSPPLLKVRRFLSKSPSIEWRIPFQLPAPPP